MKEFNSKVIIGRERSRLNVLVWMCVFIGGSVFALFRVFGIIRIDELAMLPIYMGNITIAKTFVIILIVGILWVVMSTILFLGSN